MVRRDQRSWRLLVLVCAAVAVAAMCWARVPGAPRAAAWDVAWTAAVLGALLGSLAARRFAAADERGRWSWWAAAAASWLVGQIAWEVFDVIGWPPSPNLADFGYWGFGVLFIIGLVHAPGRSRTLRLVAVVETLPLLAASMALTAALLWRDAEQSGLAMTQRLAVLVYPALFVSAAVLTLQAMVAGRVNGRVRLVLAGVVIQAVSFVVLSEQLLDRSYVSGATPLDALFVVSLLVFGAGGLAVARAPQAPAPSTDPGDNGGVLPALTFLALVLALVRAGVRDPELGAVLALGAGLLTCGAMLVVRDALLARRQRALLGAEREAREALAQRETELERLNERLVEDSRRDPLTGLRNRRALEEDIGAVEARARRRGGSFAIALCDVDHFKAYNDRLGHLAGDQALRSLAAIVRGELRGGEVAYRYGGEELLLLLGDATLAGAFAIGERVHAAVTAAALPHPDGARGTITMSIGVAAGAGDVPVLLARADAALYAAKHAGRDRVTAAGEHQALAAARPATSVEPAVVRQLRSVTAVSRAASADGGLRPVLEAFARTVRSELGFSTVVVHLVDEQTLEAVVVLGDEDARAALLGTRTSHQQWAPMLDARHERCGAYWLPAGSHAWHDSVPQWAPGIGTATIRDAWDADDALLVPLRGSDGGLIGIVAVDEPVSGRRPQDDQLTVLMAVADHTALVTEQIQHEQAALAAAGRAPAAERLGAVLLLAEALDLRDAGTADHSRTVGALARHTGAALGLSEDRVETLRAAGILHDLGKLAVPDAILHKPGELDDAEWREIRRHPEIGAHILEYAGLHDIAAWVHSHHERVDGCGYPAGLEGDAIPLEARILAVADAYEAMIADRPYRRGMPEADARAELERCAGTQFDAEVVRAFVDGLALRSGALAAVHT